MNILLDGIKNCIILKMKYHIMGVVRMDGQIIKWHYHGWNRYLHYIHNLCMYILRFLH